MSWKIVTVELFDDWFLGLNASEQQSVAEREFQDYLQKLE